MTDEHKELLSCGSGWRVLPNFSRNHLAGSYEEPPGGKQRATKRQILNPPSFWVFGMNDLAVMNTHQATRVQ
ncbi:hypothetical protein DEO72_LG5g2010 [Vigna unguiculata]|uniref:Uncharacterized protein n=1 Tax=Vigna unguiculata TaxID=3917 RepID=A0A4D6LZL5_VIGUN|nr:hypothetical protein DEO72_LG5g2010 [Vigna unguiculata]